MPTNPTLSIAVPVLTAYAREAAPAVSVPDWFPAAFPFFFAGMWVLVTTLLAWLAGHMKLLARYPPVDEPTEETFGWASGSMGWVSFNSALHVGLGPGGLHLAPNALFRPLFRRKLPCIPWGEIRLVRAQPAGVMAWFMGSKFEIPAIAVRFTLSGAAGRAVEGRLAMRRQAADSLRHQLVRER